MIRKIFFPLVVGLLCAWLGFSYTYHLPQFKIWFLYQLTDMTRKQTPVTVFAQDVHIQWYPLGLTFQNVSILPKSKDLRKNLKPIHIDQLSVGLDPVTLFTGTLGISEVRIVHPQIRTLLDIEPNVEPKVTKARQSRIEIPIRQILGIPLYRLVIEQGELDLKTPDLEFQTSNINLVIENRRSTVGLFIRPTQFQVIKLVDQKSLPKLKKPAWVQYPGTLSIDAKLGLNTFQLKNLQIQIGQQSLQFSGQGSGKIPTIEIQEAKGTYNQKIDLAQLKTYLQPWGIEIPQGHGQVEVDLNIESSAFNQETLPILTADYSAKSEDIEIAKIPVGGIKIKGHIDPENLKVEQLSVLNKSVKLQIQNGTIQLKGNDQAFNADVKINDLSLQQFLKDIQVGDVPVQTNVNSNLKCQGFIKNLNLNCEGEVEGKDFKVWNSTKTIVALSNFKAKGGFSLDKNEIKIKTKLQVGKETEGPVEGSVIYNEGFQFHFSTEKLESKDIETLAGLKLEGQIALDGTTKGNSNAATFQFKALTKDLWFEDYGLGQVKTNVAFQKGILNFENVDGIYRTSRYRGSLSVDLTNEKLRSKVQFPYLELNDMQRMFERKVKLPFVAVGSGAGLLETNGPLDFSRLSYKVESAFPKLTVDEETLKDIVFNVESVNGFVKTKDVHLKKNSSLVTLVGQAEPSAKSDISINAIGMRLEDSETLTSLGLNMSGIANWKLTMKGHILRPETRLTTAIEKFYFGKEPIPDLELDMNIEKKQIQGRTKLQDDSLVLRFEWPLDSEKPFVWDMIAKDLRLSPLIGILSTDLNNNQDLDFRASGRTQLRSEKGGFWKSSGQINLDSLYIKKGGLSAKNENQLKVSAKNGSFSAPTWDIVGDGTKISIALQEYSLTAHRYSVNGKLELGLFSFLTPFFADLRGSLSVGLQASGSGHQPQYVGSLLLDKGFVRLKTFPHPFEDIRIDGLLSGDRLSINSFRTNLAGGSGFGEGYIRFSGTKVVPVQLTGSFQNVRLDVPQNVQTTGSGEYRITGQWFPYLFQATYNVQSGLMTRPFDAEEVQVRNLPRANLLPRFILDQEFDALAFQIQTSFPQGVQIKNPMMDAEAMGQLLIKGSTNQPILDGDVNLKKGGKFFFREAPFEITAANIRFQNPRENDPNIYLSGTSRINDYDVTLIAQGTSKKLQISLRSTPPLAEQDIISLLALGATSSDIERLKTTDQVDKQGFEVGTALLSKNPLQGEIKKRTGFEVKFSSDVDQTDKASVPKIIVSKDFNPKVNLSASRTIGTRVNQNVRLQYKLTEKVSAIGSWQGRTFSEENRLQNSNQEYFGLDLQYRVQFK